MMPHAIQSKPGFPGLKAAVFAALLILAGVWPRAALAAPPEGNWTEDYKKGLSQAREQNKPALLMFSASWCGPCNQMKKNVFTMDVVKRVLAGWVTVYIDGDNHRDLMEKYEVRFFPTFVILHSDGRENGRFFGYTSTEKFLMKLDVIQRQLPALQRQIDANPRDASLWKKRGRLLESMENPDQLDQVVEAYKKALGLDPADKTLAAEVAFFDAAKMTDDGPQAIDKRFAAFIQRYPDSLRAEDALFSRIDIAMRENRASDARTLIRQYQGKYPKGKYQRGVEDVLRALNNPEGTAPGGQPRRAPAPSATTR